MLILKTKKLASESIVEPSYDTLKWLSVYRAYMIYIPDRHGDIKCCAPADGEVGLDRREL